MTKIHNINNGLSFPVVFILIPVLSFALIASYSLFLASLISVILFLYFLSSEGIQINMDEKKYRNYVQYVFLKKGKWKSLEGYDRICILKKKIAHSQASRSMRTNNFTTDLTAIYLTDATHRFKIILSSEPYYNDAERKAKVLAQQLGMTNEIYNPQISEKTKSRKR